MVTPPHTQYTHTHTVSNTVQCKTKFERKFLFFSISFFFFWPLTKRSLFDTSIKIFRWVKVKGLESSLPFSPTLPSNGLGDWLQMALRGGFFDVPFFRRPLHPSPCQPGVSFLLGPRLGQQSLLNLVWSCVFSVEEWKADRKNFLNRVDPVRLMGFLMKWNIFSLFSVIKGESRCESIHRPVVRIDWVLAIWRRTRKDTTWNKQWAGSYL